ncbi:hypothetical protein LE190_04835 [Massilia oculi]|uniref:SH3 domain-containing protein n=1 Tax=Massilia hydrophila TaxID=3044279 RepID=A0ABS7Y6C6_9BURK|nr:hypothetical protein [Massilia oculi]MCA1855250.1 hypothetical protein [Massilia oculi]
MRHPTPCFLFLLALANAASAAAPADAAYCRNGLFPREQEQLDRGVVTGQPGEKIHFFSDLDGCPTRGAQCRRPAYLVPGDAVLVGKRNAGWACVWHQGRNQETVSWIPLRSLALLPAMPVDPVRGWTGLWSDGSGSIRITLAAPGKTPEQGQSLVLASRLRWDGGSGLDGEPRAHFGGMRAPLRVEPAGRRASAAQDGCEVRLVRVGKALVADDNGACGGLNVRHTGVYYRRD